jgi:hypothetical protein
MMALVRRATNEIDGRNAVPALGRFRIIPIIEATK